MFIIITEHQYEYNFPEEEEVDKMMEQKMKEEEERKRTKEIEERMSLEETKEQVRKTHNIRYSRYGFAAMPRVGGCM